MEYFMYHVIWTFYHIRGIVNRMQPSKLLITLSAWPGYGR